MAAQENLTVFFDSFFGEDAVSGANSGKVILDTPDEILAGGMVESTEYMITYQTDTFPNLAKNDPMTVAGIAYTVRYSRKVDDGKISMAYLSKN